MAAADYREFVNKWLKSFETYKSKIKNVCAALPEVTDYLVLRPEDVRQEVVAICSEQWFHQRVFDIYLWHIGGEQLEKLR
jgi:hypothetical protein